MKIMCQKTSFIKKSHHWKFIGREKGNFKTRWRNNFPNRHGIFYCQEIISLPHGQLQVVAMAVGAHEVGDGLLAEAAANHTPQVWTVVDLLLGLGAVKYSLTLQTLHDKGHSNLTVMKNYTCVNTYMYVCMYVCTYTKLTENKVR